MLTNLHYHVLASVFLAAAYCAGAAATHADEAWPPTSLADPSAGYDPFEELAPAVATEVPFSGFDPFELPPPPAREIALTAFQQRAPQRAEEMPAPDEVKPGADPAADAAANWTPTPLCELSTNIVLPGGVLPRDYWSERPRQFTGFFDPYGTARGWPVNTFHWEASCFAHNPLYFEEINLERYGYGCGCYTQYCSTCLQSANSAAHFFATVPALPYKMAVDCPGECEYTLGHYRPGSCPPWQYHCCSRCSALGTVSAGGVATALVFIIP